MGLRAEKGGKDNRNLRGHIYVNCCEKETKEILLDGQDKSMHSLSFRVQDLSL